MSAEGGTGYQHREVIQRSRSIWGPYEASPYNPLLSNMKNLRHPFQAIGHADLVELDDGTWWAVCLGIRPVAGKQHLGRETFLAPVLWTDDGWPIGGDKGFMQKSFPRPALKSHPWKARPLRDDFDAAELNKVWNYIRNPDPEDYSLSERPGWLRLSASYLNFKEKQSPAFVGQRQTAFDMRISTRIDFMPAAPNEEAGLLVRGNDSNYYALTLNLINDERWLVLSQVLENERTVLGQTKLAPGACMLQILASSKEYRFQLVEDGKSPEDLGIGLCKNLATETIGGVTGVFIGLYASSNGISSDNAAYFEWFDFETL